MQRGMNGRRISARTMPAPVSGYSLLSVCGDVLALLMGLGTQFVVHVVGDLPVAEAAALVLGAPMLVVYRRRAFRRDLTPVYVLMGLWLANQIITDVYRHTALSDWIRGDASICFFALDVAFAAMLLGHNRRRKLLYIAGLIVGALASVVLQPNDATAAYPWKFGYSMGVNLCVAMVSCYFYNRRRYLMVLALLLGISAVNLLFDFRSPVLLFLMTIALVVPVIPEQIGPWRVLPPAGTRMRLVVLVSIALLASLAAGTAVRILSTSGLLGEDAQQKNQRQASVKGGMLIGGRPEILVSSIAVKDSPILGHGSWAKDTKYIELLYDTMYERGMTDLGDIDEIEGDTAGLIPAHSHVMSAWVWAGIMGAAFWFYVWWLLAKTLVRLAMYWPSMAPLYTYLLIGMMWDILFSPFGTGRRVMEGVVIVITLDLLSVHAPRLAGLRTLTGRGWRRGQVHLRGRQVQRPMPPVPSLGAE